MMMLYGIEVTKFRWNDKEVTEEEYLRLHNESKKQSEASEPPEKNSESTKSTKSKKKKSLRTSQKNFRILRILAKKISYLLFLLTWIKTFILINSLQAITQSPSGVYWPHGSPVRFNTLRALSCLRLRASPQCVPELLQNTPAEWSSIIRNKINSLRAPK